MSLEILSTKIEGVFIVNQHVFRDQRGLFSKTYHYDLFAQKGLPCQFKESYFSISRKDVIRGMHFQEPPYDHYKLATVIKGRIIDVVVDLRKNSQTYKQFLSVEMNSSFQQSIFIPSGCAHGFLSLEDDSIVNYNTSTVYAPEADKGIHFNSFGFKWPVENPLLSERDQKFLELKNYESPF